MSPEQVIAACDKYIAKLPTIEGHLDPERCQSSVVDPDSLTARKHILWMCEQTKQIVTHDLEKAMRWLGFIQGVLWTSQSVTIDEMKGDNAS
jgi:hypothetical protein